MILPRSASYSLAACAVVIVTGLALYASTFVRSLNIAESIGRYIRTSPAVISAGSTVKNGSNAFSLVKQKYQSSFINGNSTEMTGPLFARINHSDMDVNKITEYALETFQARLPTALPNFNTPCWYEQMNAKIYRFGFYPKLQLFCRRKNAVFPHASANHKRLRCFPSFMVLGFSKSGTTDLYKVLTKLPGIFPTSRKEPHFWSSSRLGAIGGSTCHPPKEVTGIPNMADYISLFDKAADNIAEYSTVVNGTMFHPGIVGDFTPATLTALPNWPQIWGNGELKEPRYITAHHLHSFAPRTKFIVIMRNPVTRAYSHFDFFSAKLKKRRSPEKFHDVVYKAINKLVACVTENTWRACVYEKTHGYPDHLAITYGLYAIYIKDWLDVFPRDQFLFIKAEDYYDNRYPTVRRIQKFLSVDFPVPVNVKFYMANAGAVNRLRKKGPMLQKTERLLTDFFKPFNKQLVMLLKNTHFEWSHNNDYT